MADFDNGREGFSISIDDSQLQSDAEKVVQQFQQIGRIATEIGQRIDAAFGNVSTEDLRHETEAAEDKIRDLGEATRSETEKMDASLKKIAAGVTAYFSVQKLTEFEKEIISIRSQMESLHVSFKTLAGEQMGNELFEQLKDYELRTPMIMSDLASGAQTMLAFNIPVQEVMEHLKAIGDISMGDSEKFRSLTLAFSQMSATGKLMGQDLLQMINAGFNPLQVISQQTGKSIGELKDEMEKGAISTKMVQEAFHAAASEGGQFNGMLEAQSKTMKGALSNLEGAWQYMLNDIGEAQEGFIVDSIDTAQKLIASYKQVGQVIMGLVTTYGVYRAAVMVATVAEQGHSVSMLAARASILLTQKAQALLNATMLANPYVAAATALGVLAGALIACNDGLTADERAQKSLNDELAEGRKRQEEYNRETEAAISNATKDGASTNDRTTAMQLLINRYPKIIKKYIDEEGHLRNIVQLKREIAEIDGQKTVSGYRKEAEKYGGYADIMRRVVNGKASHATSEANRVRLQYYKENGQLSRITASDKDILEYFEKKSRGYQRQADRTTSTQTAAKFTETFKNMDNKRLDTLIKTLENAKSKGAANTSLQYKELKGHVYGQGDILSMLTTAQGIKDSRGKSKSSYTAADWDKQKKEAQAKLDQMPDSKKGSKEWKKQESLLKEAQDHIASRTVSTNQQRTAAAKKQETEAEKKAKEQAKADEKKAGETYKYDKSTEQQKVDNELLQAQAIVDAMKEGEAKKLAQLDVNYKKEKAAIDKEEQSLLQAKIDHEKTLWDADPAHEKQGFYATGQQKKVELTDEEKAGITAKRASLEANTTQQRNDAIKSLLEKYDDENEKAEKTRTAINDDIEQLTKLRDEASKLGSSKLAEEYEKKRAGAVAKLQENLSNSDMEKLKKSMDWENIFNNLDTLSIEYLEKLRKRLREALSAKEITAENAQVLSQQIDKINTQITSKKNAWKEAFGLAIPELEKIRRLQKENKQAQEELNAATKEYNEALKEVEETQSRIAEALAQSGINVSANSIKASDAGKYTGQVSASGGDTNQITSLFSQLSSNQDKLASSTKNLSAATSKAGTAAQGAGSSFASTVAIIDQIVNGINKNVQSAKELVKQMDLSETKFGKGFNSFAESSQYATDGWNSLKEGNVMGVANGVYGSLRTLGDALGGWGIKGFGSSDQSLADDIERLTQSNEDLESAVGRLTEVMEDKAGQEATELYQKSKSNIETAMRNTQEMMQRSAGESSSGFLGIGSEASSNYRINQAMGASDWRRISQITGVSVRSAQDFWSLTSEQMAKVADEATDLYSKIKDKADDGKGDAAQFMDEYIEYYQKLIDLQNDYNEAVTNLSFDSAKDGLKDLLADTTKGVRDATKQVKEYMEDAILNYITKTTLAQDMQDWYSQFASAMADGRLDEGEKADLQKRYEEAYRKGEQARDAAYAAAGIDPNDDYDQSSTTATLSGMTQDQGEELNGRLASIQNSLAIVSDVVQQQVLSNASLANSAAVIRSNLDDMMEVQAQAVAHLEKIERYTSELPEMNQKLEKIRKNTENL